MIIKQAFLGVFQKLMVFCCAMFFGFANAFSANLPAGYTELEYIESSGTQWLNTGVGLSFADINFDIKFEFVSTQGTQGIFGYLNNSIWTTNFYLAKSSTNTKFIFASGTDAQNISYSVQSATPYTIVLNDSNLKINGTSFNVSRGNLSSENEIYLFNRNGSQTRFVGKIYYFKIYNGDTLVRNFVPAKNSSGVVGMYDLADPNPETAFYTNQGTGEFTGGPEVCPNGGTLQTYVSATGTVVQNGTPTPTNPIEPTFYTQGNMVLRAVGYGDNIVADTYDATTGKITRNVNSYTFTGNESFTTSTAYGQALIITQFDNAKGANKNVAPVCNYFLGRPTTNGGERPENTCFFNSSGHFYFRTTLSASDFKTWLAARYAEGNPVIAYFARSTSTTTDWTETSYCQSIIKIATRAYNTTQFAPVVSALNTAIDTIKDVVTNTINQTAAVSALQSTKQTRPDEECPAGKKCLLVEDVDGTPHWYEIIENIYGLPSGYTPLEYINNNGTAWLNLGIPIGTTDIVTFDLKWTEIANKTFFGGFDSGGSYDRYSFVGTYSSEKTKGFYSDGTGMYSFVATANTRYLIKWNGVGQKPTYNGNNFTSGGIPNVSFTPHVNAYLFTRNEAGNPGSVDKLIMYSFKVERDGQNIMNLVPAKRDSDSVIGMYDLADPNPATAFHTNQGTGTFTAGPEI